MTETSQFPRFDRSGNARAGPARPGPAWATACSHLFHSVAEDVGWVEEGRGEERLNQLVGRKLCHIQEEVWVGARTFLKADSAQHRKRETLTAQLWHQGGKQTHLGWCNLKKGPPRKKTKQKRYKGTEKPVNRCWRKKIQWVEGGLKERRSVTLMQRGYKREEERLYIRTEDGQRTVREDKG